MPKKFICEGTKYDLGGRTGETIGLPVTITNLPEKIEVKEYTLLRKTSFHISLVCIGKIIEKYHVTIPDFIEKIVTDFCEFVRTTSIDLVDYQDDFRFVTEAEKRSVVVFCGISNLDRFFDFINKKYSLAVEYPPTHVTLYTLQPDVGIFLTNKADLQKLTKKIERPAGIAI